MEKDLVHGQERVLGGGGLERPEKVGRKIQKKKKQATEEAKTGKIKVE